MKILQLIHRLQNRGAETFAAQLSNHLVAQGHDVKVVSIFEGFAKLPFVGEVECLNANTSRNSFNLKAWRKLAVIVRQFQPDIVQANSGDTLKFAVLSKCIYGWKGPLVVRNASEVGQYIKTPVQKQINVFFYRNVAKVISVSRASEKDILKIFPFMKGKTTVIPVGLEEIKSIPVKELHPLNKKHIIHVGGFSFEKNHEGLLRIFKEVLTKDSNVHLHLIGDGDLRMKVENEVVKKNLSEYITFYGFVNNPLTYIKAANVLVLPSIIEGLPGVLLEGMYCKIPVIAYDVGGISEIVTANTGHLISKNDEETFTKAIVKILNYTGEEKIEAAYKMVQNDYMNTQIAKMFLEVYKSILN